LSQTNPLEAYLAQTIQQRHEILIDLRERLLVEFRMRRFRPIDFRSSSARPERRVFF